MPGEWLGANATPPTVWAVYSAGYHLHLATRCQELDVPRMLEVKGEMPSREGGNDVLSGVIPAPHLTSSQASAWVKPPK